jgi:hypothetical protein
MLEVGLVMKVGQNLGLHCATQNLRLQSISTVEKRDSYVRVTNHTRVFMSHIVDSDIASVKRHAIQMAKRSMSPVKPRCTEQSTTDERMLCATKVVPGVRRSVTLPGCLFFVCRM